MTPKSKEWSFSINILRRSLGRGPLELAEYGKFEDFSVSKVQTLRLDAIIVVARTSLLRIP